MKHWYQKAWVWFVFVLLAAGTVEGINYYYYTYLPAARLNSFANGFSSTVAQTNVYDWANNTELNNAVIGSCLITLFGKTTVGLDVDQIAALTWTYADKISTMASGGSFAPQANMQYWEVINCTGYDDTQIIPSLGSNRAYLIRTPTSVVMAGLSTVQLQKTLTTATDLKWGFTAQTLDNSPVTNAQTVVSSNVGYKPYMDYGTALNHTIIITVTCNTTMTFGAAANGIRLIGISATPVVITNGVQFLVDPTTILYNSMHFEIDFGTGLHTTFVPVSVVLGFGTTASITTLATCT
jgi:hypothetical protein